MFNKIVKKESIRI